MTPMLRQSWGGKSDVNIVIQVSLESRCTCTPPLSRVGRWGEAREIRKLDFRILGECCNLCPDISSSVTFDLRFVQNFRCGHVSRGRHVCQLLGKLDVLSIAQCATKLNCIQFLIGPDAHVQIRARGEVS